MNIHKRILIIVISSILILFVSIILIFVINSHKINMQKSQDDYINAYLKEVGNERDEVDNFYYWLLKEHYFAIFNKEADRKEREKIYYYSTHQNEAILEMCKVPPNLYGIPLLYDIDREKGLLKCESYDRIYFDKEYLDGYDFRKVIIETGSKKEVYLINITHDEFVHRVGAKKIEEIDENGNVKDVRKKKVFDEKNTEYNFNDLCLDGEKIDYDGWYGEYYGDDIGITNHFRKKYPNFLDLFIHYSPIEYNHITLIDLDIENKDATFEVDSILECKKRLYAVEYRLDGNKYLEDCVVNILSEVDIDPDSELKLNYNGSQTFYLNTNWDKYKDVINCSLNFHNILSEYGSNFFDIKLLDYNFKFDKPYYEFIKVFPNEIGVICKFLFADGSIHFYYRKFLYNENMQLDDVINEKLPYDSSMTLEEVRDAYIRDYIEDK